MLPRLLPLILLALPAAAQFSSIELRFEGVGCAPCIESMPDRMKRLRGVESATVDAAKGVLTVKLTAQNRVRLEQVRDAIEQDGTKARSAHVEIKGDAAQAESGWMLSAAGLTVRYGLAGDALKAGSCVIAGDVTEMRPASGSLVIRVREQKMLP